MGNGGENTTGLILNHKLQDSSFVDVKIITWYIAAEDPVGCSASIFKFYHKYFF
jgi:hypothetical protein